MSLTALRVARTSALALCLTGCGAASSERPPAQQGPDNPGNAPLSPARAGVEAAPANPASVDATLSQALSSSYRSPKNKARDKFRHPKQTLEFFGLKPDMTVVELWPGTGWYTEILAPVLKARGQLIVTNLDPSDPKAHEGKMASRYAQKLADNPALFGKVRVAVVHPPTIDLGIDGQADLVLTFRNFHNWIQGGYDRAVVEAAYKALKPGGIFGVVEHRAKPGTSVDQMKKTGYVTERYIVDELQAVGFKLVAQSEMNANPRDTTDHPNGVWSLPPTLRGGDQDRATYEAIGESDRMTLKFQKPAAPASG
jgi:predicted methyltransferase